MAFQTIGNKKFFHPLKVEKYLENFHTQPKEHQRVAGLAMEKGKDGKGLLIMTISCHVPTPAMPTTPAAPTHVLTFHDQEC